MTITGKEPQLPNGLTGLEPQLGGGRRANSVLTSITALITSLRTERAAQVVRDQAAIEKRYIQLRSVGYEHADIEAFFDRCREEAKERPVPAVRLIGVSVDEILRMVTLGNAPDLSELRYTK